MSEPWTKTNSGIQDAIDATDRFLECALLSVASRVEDRPQGVNDVMRTHANVIAAYVQACAIALLAGKIDQVVPHIGRLAEYADPPLFGPLGIDALSSIGSALNSIAEQMPEAQ